MGEGVTLPDTGFPHNDSFFLVYSQALKAMKFFSRFCALIGLKKGILRALYNSLERPVSGSQRCRRTSILNTLFRA